MSISKLHAILVAIALLFAPAFASVGMASAAVPDHHAQMMDEGHCAPASGEDQNEPQDLACCGATCMAVAVTTGSVPFAKPLLGQLPVASLRGFQAGVPAELATPPPRAA